MKMKSMKTTCCTSAAARPFCAARARRSPCPHPRRDGYWPGAPNLSLWPRACAATGKRASMSSRKKPGFSPLGGTGNVGNRFLGEPSSLVRTAPSCKLFYKVVQFGGGRVVVTGRGSRRRCACGVRSRLRRRGGVPGLTSNCRPCTAHALGADLVGGASPSAWGAGAVPVLGSCLVLVRPLRP
jgi:hypothetical protein